ncbi:MAG: haloacid dehalogenase type II [Rhodospirillaceae bacterium]|nr:haloacid dehalogenase type II [Rhodospirillaceae bacterium]
MDISKIKALTFDVFGTVVDWRGSIIRDGQRMGAEWGISIDWEAFADAYRAGYQPAMEPIRTGKEGFLRIDTLHRRILDTLIPQFGLETLDEAQRDHLNKVWHRLDPWPDSVSGLTRLKKKFIISTLSNGNVALLVNMAKYAGLPWDCVLCGETFQQYKPVPEVYRGAADMLGLETEEVMMVAAHNDDLAAAAATGMRTAFIPRPTEYGPHQDKDFEADPEIDVPAKDMNDLADKLGA